MFFLIKLHFNLENDNFSSLNNNPKINIKGEYMKKKNFFQNYKNLIINCNYFSF